MATTPRTRTTSLHACSCRSFEAGTRVDLPNGDVDFVDVRTTGCNASTTRLFAQGHDAKLVSFLVAAELDNLEIALVGQGSSWGRAEDVARTISDALAIKAATMVETAQAKAAKKANKPARKAAAPKAEAALAPVVELAPIEAMIKVGRWTYPAQIDRDTRAASYKTKLGKSVTLADGDYQMV